MPTIYSQPTNLTIAAPGNPAMRNLAATMSPGSWAQLTPGNDQNKLLGVGSISGSMLHYCNSVPWNPFSKSIDIVGMDHNAGQQRYVRYHEPTNSFVLMAADTGAGADTKHGYDHTTVNPFSGDLYHRLAELGSSKIGPGVRKWVLGGSSFSSLARPSTLSYMQVAFGTCWWSGTFEGAGAQGCLLLYNSGDAEPGGSPRDGGMYAYDPLRDSWYWSSLGMSPFSASSASTYHSVLEYSPIHNCSVYGGGGAAPTKLWRMNSDRSVTPMPDVPAGKAVGVQLGNLVVEPVSGNFLLFSAGELWELDPRNSGKWKPLGGSRTPPVGIGTPGPSKPDGIVSCAVANHGVVAYIKQSSSTGGTFYLYKHA